MKNTKKTKKTKNESKNGKFKPGSKRREKKYIVTFDDKGREEYLTGFHKRKVERRKVAVSEIRKKIKEEQIRVREERHTEYIRVLKERTDALEEAEDELEDVITGQTESVQFDHPNHTVTVTTITELDLTGAHLLGPVANQVDEDGNDEETGKERGEVTRAMPRKAGNPIMNKKIRSLNSSLSSFTTKGRAKGKGKGKGKQEGRGGRGQQTDKKQNAAETKKKSGRTSKGQRRRLTGKKVHHRV
ncbi:nucleolar protein 12 [Pseudoliparis swirei]|uniref:nucleolar protein 12 n=1 Tax=Pseudoliparis swirei TaxID=2059687 RepID=UPI0024BEBCF2|nr:nucleolar protein 12 [Pseudoliparis swirei]